MCCAPLDILAVTAAGRCAFTLCCHIKNSSCLLLLVCYCLARALAGTGIGLRPLSPYGKSLTMTDTAVATNFNKPFNIESHVAAKISFHMKVMIDVLAQLCNVVFGQVLHSCVRIDAGGGKYIVCGLTANTKIYVSPISTLFSRGRSTPEIRAIFRTSKFE